MKKIFWYTTLVLALVACKKEKNNPASTVTSASYVIPTGTGSYWVYRWDKTDSNGVVTPAPYTDTIWIAGDTVIQNKTYIVYSGTRMGSVQNDWFERDSSGYIVDHHGKILYSYLNGSGSYYQEEDALLLKRLFFAPAVSLTVDAGTFNEVIDALSVYSSIGNLPLSSCYDSTASFHNYYASGVGLLRMETGFYSDVLTSCNKRTATLTSYHIVP